MKRQQKKGTKRLTKKMKTKLVGLLIVILLALVALIFRITYISIKSGDRYTRQVLTQSQQQYESTTVPFKRGDILDRNGNTLATSVKVYNVILDCSLVNSDKKYRKPTVDALSDYLGIDSSVVEAKLDDESTANSQYQILKKVSMDERKHFLEMNEITDDNKDTLKRSEYKRRSKVKGVWFEEHYQREYPFHALASTVIGFSSVNNTASLGIEGYYSSTLNGTDGKKYGYLNSDDIMEQNIVDAVDGKTVVSTIDVNIQSIVEKYISAFNEKLRNNAYEGDGAENIGVIVENPNNGEILAMAGKNTFDLNDPRAAYANRTDLSDEEISAGLDSLWKNFCVSSNYELGSVIKPIIVASALESGAVSDSDVFVCDGGEQIGNDYVRCAVYPYAHGTETLGEVIQNSCNDGMMAIGRKMGAALLLDYQSRFNFGSRTGIDLPNESSGAIYTLDQMKDMELASTTFGQGFTSTMIQEISAISAVINGGTYYQPHVVKEIKSQEDGSVLKTNEGNVLKHIVSSDVSEKIREYMGMSVTSGTSRKSKVQGYSMGGKTGTAEILSTEEKDYLVSFIGFAPLDTPQVVVYVVVDRPNVEEQADSSYAQYIAQAILDEILPYMNIYPDEETEETTKLWDGFKGVLKLDDSEVEVNEPIVQTEGSETGTDNAQDIEVVQDESGSSEEYNDEESDGVASENAGYEETVSEDVSDEEDTSSDTSNEEDTSNQEESTYEEDEGE